MREKTIVIKDTNNERLVEKYILKYVNDLKLHFTLNDKVLIRALSNVLSYIKKEERSKSFGFFYLLNLFSNQGKNIIKNNVEHQNYQ